MNILLINHQAGSNRHGMSYRPFYLAREWARLGHQVTIVAAAYTHLRAETPEVRGSASEEDIEGIHYIWVRTPPYQGSGIRRAANMAVFLRHLLRHERELILQCDPDVVIAGSDYHLDGIPAQRIARACHAGLVKDVRDLWPLTLIELGGMSRWHPFILLLQWAENLTYRCADRVVSALPLAQSHMSAHGMAVHKFAYVPNGVDVTDWERRGWPVTGEHGRILECLKAQGRFIIGYVGSHGMAHSLDNLLDAATLLQSRSVAFVLVGKGPAKQALEERAARLGLRNLVFLPPVAKSSVSSVLRSMDALFIGWKRRAMYRYGISPTKMMDYMLSGRPIIHAVQAGNDMVAESGCGLTVPPEDPEALASGVAYLMKLTEGERAAMGQRGRDYVFAHHDYRALAEHYLTIIEPLQRRPARMRPPAPIRQQGGEWKDVA